MQAAADPERAQEIVLTKYSGRRATAQDAETTAGWEPLILRAPEADPEIFVLLMPRSVCIQRLINGRQKGSVAAFEYESDQSAWFGELPATECQCEGVAVNVVQCGGQFTATWQVKDRSITVVGLPDLGAVASFIRACSSERSR